MAGLQPVDQTARTTFPAWNPFGPFSRSNSTISPSFKVRYPFSWMAEKCTNTSSPVDRWMKPNPLAPLNHFTVPFSLTNCSFRPYADWNLLHRPSRYFAFNQWMEPDQALCSLPLKQKMPQRPLPSRDPRRPDRLR